MKWHFFWGGACVLALSHVRTLTWKNMDSFKELVLSWACWGRVFCVFLLRCSTVYSQLAGIYIYKLVSCLSLQRVLELRDVPLRRLPLPHKFLGPNSGLHGLRSPTISVLSNIVLVGFSLFKLFWDNLAHNPTGLTVVGSSFLTLLSLGITGLFHHAWGRSGDSRAWRNGSVIKYYKYC